MAVRWPILVVRGLVIALLVLLIVGITAATLMPVIYRTDWFQQRYVKVPR
jgi:hypothetical protein